MQFESFKRETPTINLSALIDVVFILLIFVVLAANFDRIRELQVVLPTAEAASEARPEALVLTGPVEGPMLLNEVPVAEDALLGELTRFAEDYDVLLLVGDGGVDLERTVSIFDDATKAGFESVSIATRQASQ